MARIPKNKIITNQQAVFNEFVYVDSGLAFSGSYHIISGKTYAGTNERVYAQPVPIERPQNNALANVINNVGLGSAAYNLALRNKTTARNLSSILIHPHIVRMNSPLKIGVSYYLQKSNDFNHIIKKISYEEGYHLAKDPNNKIISIDFSSENLDEQLVEAEKIIPGITTFVNL